LVATDITKPKQRLDAVIEPGVLHALLMIMRFKELLCVIFIDVSLIKKFCEIALVTVDGLDHKVRTQRLQTIMDGPDMVDGDGNVMLRIDQRAVHVKDNEFHGRIFS